MKHKNVFILTKKYIKLNFRNFFLKMCQARLDGIYGKCYYSLRNITNKTYINNCRLKI